MDRQALVELADVLASLGCVVSQAPPEQVDIIRAALSPLVEKGLIGPAVVLDSTVPVERRQASLREAVDRLLGL